MRIVRRITPVAIGSALLILGGVCIYLHQLKRSAERFVRVSYEFSTGDNAPTLVDLRQRFGTEVKAAQPVYRSRLQVRSTRN